MRAFGRRGRRGAEPRRPRPLKRGERIVSFAGRDPRGVGRYRLCTTIAPACDERVPERRVVLLPERNRIT